MMKTKLYLLLIGLLMGVISVVYSQSDVIQATWIASPSEVTVGDVITLTLSVTHPTGYRVIVPEFGDTWGYFEVRSIGQQQISAGDDETEITSVNLDVAVMNVGDFNLPDLPITVYDSNGQASTVNPSPLPIHILSVLQEGDTTLRDIKGQVDLTLPERFPIAEILFLGILTLVGGALFIVYEFKKRRKVTFVDNRLPYEKAFDELKHIEMLNFPATAEYKEHYDWISQCMRQYLQDGLNIPALERTTTELKQILRTSDIPHDVVRDIVDILLECDYVKFGSIQPELSDAQSIGSRVGYIIERTRPHLETTPESERSVA